MGSRNTLTHVRKSEMTTVGVVPILSPKMLPYFSLRARKLSSRLSERWWTAPTSGRLEGPGGK